MLRRPASETGFTLIELMVVVAIIAILAALAIGTVSKEQQVARLNQGAGDLQAILFRARNSAVRTGYMQKVCIYRDPDSTDNVAMGLAIRFTCNTPGDSFVATISGCPAETICDTGKSAADAGLYDATKVTCGVNTWCLSGDPDSNLNLSGRHVGINGFLASTNVGAFTPLAGQAAIEVTYNSQGTIDTQRTTNGFTQGGIYLTSWDFCAPGIPPGGTCSGFERYAALSYVFGGPVRVNR